MIIHSVLALLFNNIDVILCYDYDHCRCQEKSEDIDLINTSEVKKCSMNDWYVQWTLMWMFIEHIS